MRCFFRIAGETSALASDGIEFETVDAARIQATRFLADVISEHPEAVWQGENVRVDVEDEHHALMFSIMVVAADSPAIDHTDLT